MREKERLKLNMKNVNIKEQNLRDETNLVTDSKRFQILINSIMKMTIENYSIAIQKD